MDEQNQIKEESLSDEPIDEGLVEESIEDPVLEEPVDEPPIQDTTQPSVPTPKKKKKSGGGWGATIIILILIGVIIYVGHYMAQQVKDDPKSFCTLGLGPLSDPGNLEQPLLCYGGHTKAGGTIEYDPLESELRKNI